MVQVRGHYPLVHLAPSVRFDHALQFRVRELPRQRGQDAGPPAIRSVKAVCGCMLPQPRRHGPALEGAPQFLRDLALHAIQLHDWSRRGRGLPATTRRSRFGPACDRVPTLQITALTQSCGSDGVCSVCEVLRSAHTRPTIARKFRAPPATGPQFGAAINRSHCDERRSAHQQRWTPRSPRYARPN